MAKSKTLFLLSLILLLLTSCANADVSGPISQPVAFAAEAATTPTPTSPPTEETSAEAEPDDCLACHTDKQQLIDTAKPEAPTTESESKGVG